MRNPLYIFAIVKYVYTIYVFIRPWPCMNKLKSNLLHISYIPWWYLLEQHNNHRLWIMCCFSYLVENDAKWQWILRFKFLKQCHGFEIGDIFTPQYLNSLVFLCTLLPCLIRNLCTGMKSSHKPWRQLKW